MTPAAISGEQQISISGGCQSPAWYTLRGGAERPVDVRLAPTGVERRPQGFGKEDVSRSWPESRAKTRERVLNMTDIATKSSGISDLSEVRCFSYWE